MFTKSKSHVCSVASNLIGISKRSDGFDVFNHNRSPLIVQSINTYFSIRKMKKLLQSSAFLESTEYFRRLRVRQQAEQIEVPLQLRCGNHEQIYTQFLRYCSLSDRMHAKLIATGLTDNDIEFLLVSNCPGIIQNLEICASLVREFGAIDHVSGFVRTELNHTKLDLGAFYDFENVGVFLCANFDDEGHIAGIKLFRYLNDKHAFVVRTRTDQRGGTA